MKKKVSGVKSQGASEGKKNFAADPNNPVMLQTFFDLSQSILGIIKREEGDFKFLYLNQATTTYTGVTPESYYGKSGSEVGMTPDIVSMWLRNIDTSRNTKSKVTFEYGRTILGKQKYFSITVKELNSTEGTFVYIAQDITDLRLSEQALVKNQQLLKNSEKYVQMGSWEWDLASDVLTWSVGMRNLFGVTAEESPRSHDAFLKLVHPEDRARLAERISNYLKSGSPHHNEFRVVQKDGSIRWIEKRGHPLVDFSNKVTQMIGVALDITQRKRTEELFEAQSAKMLNLSKMSALGEMASGVAHEINNPLTILRANAAIIRKEIRKPSVDIEKLDKIALILDSTCDRAAQIIEGLRFFARDGSTDGFETIAINSVIADTLSFCTERFKTHGISFTVHGQENALLVNCQPVQISQVILNLLNNAYDAIGASTQKSIILNVKKVGQAVEISVQDSGPGVPSGIQNQMFKPFFTTKPPDKGTGLGLSIVKGIAESHGGSIRYERQGDLTCFILTLPLAGGGEAFKARSFTHKGRTKG